jgi:hypothetical protein
MSSTDLSGLEINPFDLKLPRFSPDELMGRTFLRQLHDGQKYHAKIHQKIQDNDAENHNKIKFLIEIGDGNFDEIISYNTLCDLVEDQNEDIIEEEKPGFSNLTKDTKAPSRKKILTMKDHLTMS